MTQKKLVTRLSLLKLVFFGSLIIGIVVGVLMLNDKIPYDSCNAWDGGIPGGYCDAPNYTSLGKLIFFLAPFSLLVFLVSGSLLWFNNLKGK